MNTFFLNNTARIRSKALIVITETTFRKIQDNLLCGTKNGSWNDHWLYTEANNLAEAKANFINNGWGIEET